MNWFKQIKLASIRYLYHGTSLNNLNSILSEGLNTSHGRVYDESFQNEKGDRHVESYGGVYFTDNLRTALMSGFTASEKNKIDTSTSVVVIAQIEDRTPSVLIDEDLLATPFRALASVSGDPSRPANLAQWITQGFPNIEKAVDNYLNELSSSRTIIENKRFLKEIRPYVYDILKTYAIQRLCIMIELKDFGTSYLVYDYPELNNLLPDKDTAIQNYRDAFSLFMKKAHRITSFLDDTFQNNMRITTPISYRGKNKIILVSTIQRIPYSEQEKYNYIVDILYLSNNNILEQYLKDIRSKYSENILMKYKDSIIYDKKKEQKVASQQLNLSFEHIHEDFHNDQHDYVLVAKDSTTLNPVGMIEYSLYDNEIYINNILVKKDLRRMGVGTKMIEDLKREHNVNIHWGMLTEEGSYFQKSLETQ